MNFPRWGQSHEEHRRPSPRLSAAERAALEAEVEAFASGSARGDEVFWCPLGCGDAVRTRLMSGPFLDDQLHPCVLIADCDLRVSMRSVVRKEAARGEKRDRFAARR